MLRARVRAHYFPGCGLPPGAVRCGLTRRRTPFAPKASGTVLLMRPADTGKCRRVLTVRAKKMTRSPLSDTRLRMGLYGSGGGRERG